MGGPRRVPGSGPHRELHDTGGGPGADRPARGDPHHHPEWDPFMDAYARSARARSRGRSSSGSTSGTCPPLVRPVPYLLPVIPGFEGQSVDDPRGRGRAGRCHRARDGPRSTWSTSGGWISPRRRGRPCAGFRPTSARSSPVPRSRSACGEGDELAKSVELLVRRIAGGADRDLPWDQRVGLADRARAGASARPRPCRGCASAWPSSTRRSCARSARSCSTASRFCARRSSWRFPTPRSGRFRWIFFLLT
jgi:hypothetical protein